MFCPKCGTKLEIATPSDSGTCFDCPSCGQHWCHYCYENGDYHPVHPGEHCYCRETTICYVHPSPEPPYPRICPLLYIGGSMIHQGEESVGHCIGDNCAWWTHDQCAMVDLCADVYAVASGLVTIERHLKLIANKGGDGR